MIFPLSASASSSRRIVREAGPEDGSGTPSARPLAPAGRTAGAARRSPALPAILPIMRPEGESGRDKTATGLWSNRTSVKRTNQEHMGRGRRQRGGPQIARKPVERCG